MRILTVIGARPQFIKACPVSLSFKESGIEELLLHTGQHYDSQMSNVFFEELSLPKPYKNLKINGGTHGQMTGRMLTEIEKELIHQRPDLVLVYGDTNSTLAGALAAVKLKIPIVHIEAGLRSFNSQMPEETNRILTDRISSYLFCPTRIAVENLNSEGIVEHVHEVGDVMYDSSLMMAERAEDRSSIIKDLVLEKEQFILATVHRAENTDDNSRLQNILEVLSELNTKTKVIFPIHPRTRSIISKHFSSSVLNDINVIDPVSYFDIIALQRSAQLIITDSGGMQKEAYFYKVPCVTLRDETEWVETVDSKWNTLMSPEFKIDADNIERKMNRSRPPWTMLYGDGNAAKKITSVLKQI